jgi:hypothetical protein
MFYLASRFRTNIWLSARDGDPSTSTHLLRRQYKTLDGSEYIPFSAWANNEPALNGANCVVVRELTWQAKPCVQKALVVCLSLFGNIILYYLMVHCHYNITEKQWLKF